MISGKQPITAINLQQVGEETFRPISSENELNLSKVEANIIASQSIQFADELLKELDK